MLNRRNFNQVLAVGVVTGGRSLYAAAGDQAVLTTVDLTPRAQPQHWSVATDEVWQWFERQSLIDGKWKVTGLTTPIHVATGERYTGETGYLADELVPDQLRFGGQITPDAIAALRPSLEAASEPTGSRKARHGRPPSPWLRSLNADELREWLPTIEVPQAGVSGMTFWTHLTRDHGFAPHLIEGLTEREQAKLHAAAHFGY